MTEYLISDELLTSIRQACYRAGRAGKEVFTVRTPSEEVVRCRDCKWLRNYCDYGAWCGNSERPLYGNYDHFCARGERREDTDADGA